MNRFPGIRHSRQVKRRTLVLFAAVTSIVVGAAVAAPVFAAAEAPVVVSMGDSYTSGTGLTPYDVESAANGCKRSTNGYATVLRRQLSGGGADIACSGATTAAFTHAFKGEPAQVEQLAAFSRQTTVDYVVLTVGGNDVKIFDTLSLGSSDAFLGLTKNIGALPAKLTATYAAVRQAAPQADVLVAGYPNILPTTQAAFAGCVGETIASKVDVSVLSNSLSDVNAATQAAVKASKDARLHYVSADGFKGHDICSDDPYAFRITLKGGSFDGSLHPNAAGHEAIATAINSVIDELPARSDSDDEGEADADAGRALIPVVDMPSDVETVEEGPVAEGMGDAPAAIERIGDAPAPDVDAELDDVATPVSDEVDTAVSDEVEVTVSDELDDTATAVSDEVEAAPAERTTDERFAVAAPQASASIQVLGETQTPAAPVLVEAAPEITEANPVSTTSAPTTPVLQLASTGAELPGTLGLVFMFFGLGLAAMWLRLVRLDRLAMP